MPHRPRAWADLLFNIGILNNTNMVPLDILFDLGASRLSVITVVRLVAQFAVVGELPLQVATGTSRIDVGIGVATVEGFDGGATTTPQPDVSTEYPIRGWLYATTKVVFNTNNSGSLSAFPQWEVDMRAMRKIDKGILYLAAANNNADGDAINVRLIGRVRALCLT